MIYENEDDGPSKGEVLEELRNENGQTYITAGWAYAMLAAFRYDVSDEFTEKHSEVHEVPEAALSHALADRQRVAREASGFTSCPPHEMVTTYAAVSGILADALTGDESDYQAVGAGYTADGRHSENVKTIGHVVETAPEAE